MEKDTSMGIEICATIFLQHNAVVIKTDARLTRANTLPDVPLIARRQSMILVGT
jgi:hypothetical protein